jgi:hypothetical protein
LKHQSKAVSLIAVSGIAFCFAASDSLIGLALWYLV